jgi:hypothetical protein
MKRGCRKLHNEEIHNLYSSASVIRMIKSRGMVWVGHVAQMREKSVYRLLVEKPEAKRPLRRPRCRHVENIKTDLGEIGWGGMDLFDLAQDRDQCRALVNLSTNLFSSPSSMELVIVAWRTKQICR